jgi:hypothetical protein
MSIQRLWHLIRDRASFHACQDSLAWQLRFEPVTMDEMTGESSRQEDVMEAVTNLVIIGFIVIALLLG